MRKPRVLLIRTAIITFIVAVVLALMGGLAIGRRTIVDPIRPANAEYRPLALFNVDTHETTLGIPFVFTLTFVRSPYDLRLKVIDHDLSTTAITVKRVELTSPDGSTRTKDADATFPTVEYQHIFIDANHANHAKQTKSARLAQVVLPGCLPATGEFKVKIFGIRQLSSGRAIEVELQTDLRMQKETIFVTHRGLAALGSV